MSEAQEPRIQPLAQAQPEVQVQTQVQTHTSAQTQSQPQPVLALPATINKESSNSGHGNTLPALVSSNLPGASILERILSQPSQAPDKSDTHTQASSRTHDQTRAHVNRPEEQLRAQEIVRSEDIDTVTNTQRSHGVAEAAGAREADNDLNIPAVDVIESTLKTFPSLPPISESIANSTNTTLPSTTVAADPATANSTSTSNLASSNVVPLEIQNAQHIGPTSLPKGSTTAMSNPPQHPGHARPPVGFPSPTYGPQGIYGYGSPPGPPGDIYRGHPGGHQPMSLPSMRTFDPVQQQQAQQAPMAQQMMQVQSSMPPYYGHAVPLAGNPYSLPPEAMNSRYALPPGDPRFQTNPRNKKEIKRRTKTGCLTCRKRRIKCDEQHPVCKNCQKSKRECLGYDPIFKQQQQHPSNIQPAPNSSGSHPAPATSVPSNGPPLPSPSSTAPSTTTTYGSLPSVLPSSYNSGASSSSNTPANAYESSHSAPPSTVKSEHFEYGGPAIDPALDTVGGPSSTSTPHLPPVKSVAPILSPIAQRPPSTTLNLRGGGSCFPPYHSPQRAAPYQHWTSAYSDYSANKMRVDDLINWGRPPPSNSKVPPDQSKLDEIRGLYEEIYAPGLEGFFETKWYTEESTVNRLMFHTPILETLAGFLNVVAKAEQNHQSTMTEPADLEFRLVWELACFALVTNEPKANPPSVIIPDNDPTEARNRVVVVEALLSGTVLGDNPLVRPPPVGDYHRVRELDFWYHVGEFCRVEPAGNPPNSDILSQRDQILSRIRMLLDGRENRDVLYSIVIMRALSPEYPSDFESTLPQHLDEDDPRCKLSVARKFVRDEAKVTGGTTNIVRRFSELAAMAFISPGVNVSRHR